MQSMFLGKMATKECLNNLVSFLIDVFCTDEIKIQVNISSDILSTSTSEDHLQRNILISLKVFGEIKSWPNIDTLVANLSPVSMEINILHQKVQKSFTIVKNSITKYKKIISSSNEEMIEIQVHTNDDVKKIEKNIQEIKLKYPKSKFHYNNADNQNQESEGFVFKKHCQQISESIANTIMYSLNTNFRKKCMKILNVEQNTFLSVQDIVMEKLENLEKY